MCFYNDDYDWYASVQEVSNPIATKAVRCDECFREIQPGESYTHIYQQEHEECQRCEWEELEPDEEPCQKHDYGETYDYDRCDQCSKILEAIKAVEIEEGCPEYAQQPALCELSVVFSEHESASQYAERAVKMFPELKTHSLLANFVS